MFSWFSNQKITPSQNNGQPDAAGWAPQLQVADCKGFERWTPVRLKASRPFFSIGHHRTGARLGRHRHDARRLCGKSGTRRATRKRLLPHPPELPPIGPAASRPGVAVLA